MKTDLSGKDADAVVIAAQSRGKRGAVAGWVSVHFSAEGVFFAVYFQEMGGAQGAAFF